MATEKLVQTNMCQQDACNSCKYVKNCDECPGGDCLATNGQHYPKEFVLPEKWVVNAHLDGVELSLINNYFNKLSNSNYFTGNYHYYHFPDKTGAKVNTSYNRHTYRTIIDGYTEITFSQFKKYVLKETIEEPKEQDWSKATKEELLKEAIRRYPIGTKIRDNKNSKKVYAVEKIPFFYWDRWIAGCNQGGVIYCDNKWAEIISLPVPDKKFSVGTYIVFLQNFGRSKKGDVDEIIESSDAFRLEREGIATNEKDWIKWFATKAEAEEFAKTLITMEKYITDNIYKIEWDNHFCICKYEKMNDSDRMVGYYIANSNGKLKFERSTPWITGRKVTLASKEDCEWLELCIKTNKFMEKPIQSLKQAVHCKTQEEWDFVTEKLGYKWAQHCSFSAFSESTCISLIDTQYSYVDYLKNDYQILSFQEWCDLNGYRNTLKMETARPDSVIGIDYSGYIFGTPGCVGHSQFAGVFLKEPKEKIPEDNFTKLNYLPE